MSLEPVEIDLNTTNTTGVLLNLAEISLRQPVNNVKTEAEEVGTGAYGDAGTTGTAGTARSSEAAEIGNQQAVPSSSRDEDLPDGSMGRQDDSIENDRLWDEKFAKESVCSYKQVYLLLFSMNPRIYTL